MAKAQAATTKGEPARAGQDGNGLLMERLAAIDERGRQTLELLNSLIGLLLQNSDRTGPRLEDLLATMIVLQREGIAISRAIQAGVSRLEGRLPAEPSSGFGNGHEVPRGARS
jgi:hypothetical protein